MKSISFIALLMALVHFSSGTVFYPVTYASLGCWKDTSSRAVAPLEGSTSDLRGEYTKRDDPIQKCAAAAASKSFDVFSVQNGGWCGGSAHGRSTYRRYGGSSKCGKDGEGGAWANQVYEIQSTGAVQVKSVGCFVDRSHRAIPTLEGRDPILNGNYYTRQDAMRKCVTAAFARGYTMIGIQNGGQCFGSRDAEATYARYGSSRSCKSHGKGGAWANHVYRLNYLWTKSYQ